MMAGLAAMHPLKSLTVSYQEILPTPVVGGFLMMLILEPLHLV